MLATIAELRMLSRYKPLDHPFWYSCIERHGSIIPCSVSLSHRENALARRTMSSSLRGAGCHSHPAPSCKLPQQPLSASVIVRA